MDIRTLVNRLLKKDNGQTQPIPIYRLETPEKIIETKIHPVKIPGIFEVSERLANISHEITILKNEMVSKSWFKDEFEDISPAVIDKLNEINNNLTSLRENFTNFTNQFSSRLSNFTKYSTVQITDVDHYSMPLNTSEIVFSIIKANKKIRYKDILKQLPVSDPTLSKYLKILVSEKKIRRSEIGKAVFYEAI